MPELADHIRACLDDFLGQVASEQIEIYNEASVQYELAILLRQALRASAKVQLERPYAALHVSQTARCVKKEIDIAVFTPDQSSVHAIEIKFPRNGQYPEQMFSFCKDVLFLEQLAMVGVGPSWFLVIADDHLFWEGQERDGIYGAFRSGQPISGRVLKPTGSTSEVLEFQGRYPVAWHELDRWRKYALIEVRRPDFR